MKLFILFIFSVLFQFVLSNNIFSQDNWWKEKKYKSEEKKQKFNNCKLTFMNIADGFMYSNVNYISPFLHNEVYLNLQNNDKGYFNKEQSVLIIENFLSSFPVSSFKWRNSSKSELFAFAMGKYKYKKGGFISTFTISVSLKYINQIWLIDQILVN